MTAHIKVPDDMIMEIVGCWNYMNSHERSQAVKEATREYNVSIGSVYRRIKTCREYGIQTSKKRSDKGKPRVLDDNDMLESVKAVMGFKAHDPNKPDKRVSNPNKVVSTARAIEILEKMRKIPKGILNVRTVNRWAKIYRITVEDICAEKPAVKIVSEHPNHVHVVDFSVCEQYYLREKEGKIATRTWTYKNKPNESKKKIWTFALVDHYSNVKYIKYFLSAGESSAILYKGLIEAWVKKDDSRFPFHGVPRYLYADKGSALKSERIQNLLHALGVEVICHKPGNPRAKGMVESAFKHLQTDFESELRHYSALTLEELNERVYNWLLHHNWSVQKGTDKRRFTHWQEITTEQLQELPPDHILKRVTASHLIRTVDAYCTVSLNGKRYGVPEEIFGKKVRVWHNIDNGITVQDIETGKLYQNVEQKIAVFGEFNAHRKSSAERMQDEAIRAAREIVKDITPEILMRDVPNLYSIPKSGTSIKVNSDLVQNSTDEYRSVYKAKMAIAEELRINLGDLPEWMIKEIDNILAHTLNKDKVHKISRFIEDYLREARSAV